MKWLEQAACVDHDPEVFFPHEKNQNCDWETPRTVCRICPVWEECLRAANDRREDFGMFGGLTPVQRRNGWTKIPAPPVEDWHGTPQGVDRHRYRSEPPCDPCRLARNRRQAERDRQRRESAA